MVEMLCWEMYIEVSLIECIVERMIVEQIDVMMTTEYFWMMVILMFDDYIEKVEM